MAYLPVARHPPPVPATWFAIGIVGLVDITVILSISRLVLFHTALAMILESTDSRPVGRAHGAQFSSRKDTPVVARAVVIEPFANDFAAADNNATVAVVKRRQWSLHEAEGEIQVVTRHTERYSYVCRFGKKIAARVSYWVLALGWSLDLFLWGSFKPDIDLCSTK